MKHHRVWLALLAVLVAADDGMRAQATTRDTATITVRPATLAAAIEELAGTSVRIPQARVVGVFNPQVLVIDAATLRPGLGDRRRLAVLVENRQLKIPPTLVVGSTVTIVGVARTLLGVQVSREVPWPREIGPELVKRLEIRAAVLARSVRSADGVELTSPMTPGP
jgi:hypothetical protein